MLDKTIFNDPEKMAKLVSEYINLPTVDNSHFAVKCCIEILMLPYDKETYSDEEMFEYLLEAIKDKMNKNKLHKAIDAVFEELNKLTPYELEEELKRIAEKKEKEFGSNSVAEPPDDYDYDDDYDYGYDDYYGGYNDEDE